MISGLEKILNYLVNNKIYYTQICDIIIAYKGTKEDTYNDKRQIFEIQRKVE